MHLDAILIPFYIQHIQHIITILENIAGKEGIASNQYKLPPSHALTLSFLFSIFPNVESDIKSIVRKEVGWLVV